MRRLSVLAFLLASACVSSTAPPGYLSPVTSSPKDIYGGWVAASYPKTTKRISTEGELIAVTPDALIVLTDSGALRVAKSDVEKVVVNLYEPDEARVRNLAAAGMVSTISHGGVAVFSIPLWILARQSDYRELWRLAQVIYPEEPWEKLANGARFPQGLPTGLDITKIQANPLIRPRR